MWYLLDQAPNGFGSHFLEWLQGIENSLSVSFADWHPSDEETQELERWIQQTGQEVPTTLQIYYRHAYPFDNVKNGALLWSDRVERYFKTWREQQRSASLPGGLEDLVSTAKLMLWPIDCFRHFDTVAFSTAQGDLVVIHIDALSAKVTPVAVELRNYFLTQVGLQILAAELNVQPDWDMLCSDPRIASLSRWPTVGSSRQ